MSSLLQTLGFRVDGQEEFEALAAKTLDQGETEGSPDPGWRSVRWDLDGGPSLWAHESPRGAIECFSPALRAERAVRLFLSRWYDNADCAHCSGAVFEFRGETDDGEPLFPFAAHVPDVALVRRGLGPGGSHQVRLGAIAERVEVSPPGGPEPSVFLAVGLVGPDGERSEVDPSALIGGTILASEIRSNPFSGLPWNWARIDARGLVFEVAVASGDAPEGLVPGSILRGTFHLTALVEPTKGRERPSGWSQLYREGRE